MLLEHQSQNFSVNLVCDLQYMQDSCGSMSRVEGYRESDLRSQLRACRTEIAMAIHDPFPLLYGLADHDIISEQILMVNIFIKITFLSIIINMRNHSTLNAQTRN